jgi:hypothetical protein
MVRLQFAKAMKSRGSKKIGGVEIKFWTILGF